MNPKERIYIIPTWAGILFAVTIFLVFAAGYVSRGFGGTPQVLVIALVVAGIIVLGEVLSHACGRAGPRGSGGHESIDDRPLRPPRPVEGAVEVAMFGEHSRAPCRRDRAY